MNLNNLFFFQDYVEQCLLEINKMIRESSGVDSEDHNGEDDSNEPTPRPGEFTPPLVKNQDHQTAALTPTDVHDVHF